MAIPENDRLPTILLVDNDPALLMQLGGVLSACFNILIAPDVRNAVNIIEKNQACDLIITDIVMPAGDGLSLIKHLRSKPRKKRIPVIVCSSTHDDVTVSRALEAGAIDFLAKPLNLETLLPRVERALVRGSVAVLVVDDNLVLLELVAKVVGREGFQVHLATTAEDALTIFMEKRVDAVISDIGLPGMNGLELLIAIKEKKPKMPVLLITGNSGHFTKENAISAVADGYITKPFKNTEIAAKLNALI